MKKKLKFFFNSLEVRPEVIAHGCQKEVISLTTKRAKTVALTEQSENNQ